MPYSNAGCGQSRERENGASIYDVRTERGRPEGEFFKMHQILRINHTDVGNGESQNSVDVIYGSPQTGNVQPAKQMELGLPSTSVAFSPIEISRKLMWVLYEAKYIGGFFGVRGSQL